MLPLLKGINKRLPPLKVKQATMDAGYDWDPIYKQIGHIGAQSIISCNKENEPDPIGFNNLQLHHFVQSVFNK